MLVSHWQCKGRWENFSSKERGNSFFFFLQLLAALNRNGAIWLLIVFTAVTGLVVSNPGEAEPAVRLLVSSNS